MLKKSSPLQLLGQMEPNLTGSIYVRSSIKCLRFVPFCQQIWLPRVNLVTVQWPSNLHRIFMSRTVSQLLFEIDHLYLFYKYFVRCTCQSARCHLNLTSFSWYSDLRHIFMSRSVSQLLQETDQLYLVNKYIVKCRCQSKRCHLTLTSFSRSSDLYHIFMSKYVSQLL
jgi:hypothetical protein